MRTVASLAMPRRLPPGCYEDRDRHGNVRIYFRAKGRPEKTRIRGVPWTPPFMAAYEAAKDQAVPTQRKGITPRHMALVVRPLFYRMRGIQTP